MLTKVRLDGVMGKEFGREWEFDVSSPAEALRMIEANKPGLKKWIIENRDTYNAYRVVCTYADGREEALNDDTYALQRQVTSIRFTPTVSGSGGAVKAIVGIIIVAVNFITGFNNPYVYQFGAALILGGVIEMLSPRPKTQNQSGDSASSFYFDGPVNTEMQGSPVPLVYGRVITGSHVISAAVSIDEVV